MYKEFGYIIVVMDSEGKYIGIVDDQIFHTEKIAQDTMDLCIKYNKKINHTYKIECLEMWDYIDLSQYKDANER
jgi:hypothetical protein